jgi:ubiquinone/menaquinone biosynthesis C-methylase UbiE
MKRVLEYQTNTKVYWNDSYGNPTKASEYKASSERFEEAVKFIKEGDKFIDLGCGVATPARLLKKNNVKTEVWGVDISDVVIEQNKGDIPEGKWQQGYVGSLDFLPKNYFDVVFSGEVIEHLDDPADLFREAYSILKDGGKLIITTPIEDKIRSEEHVWSFDKEDMIKLFTDAGFKDLKFVELKDLEYTFIFFVVGTK